MGVEQDIEAIRVGIRAGRFSNEASVSTAVEFQASVAE